MPTLSLLPHDEPREPELRRAMDAATLELIRSAATGPVQLAELSAQVSALRNELGELRASAHRTEGALQRLISLGEQANETRSQELEEARQARAQRAAAAAQVRDAEARERAEQAAWWRALLEPRTMGIVVLIVILWLLDQGSLIPGLVAAVARP